MFYIDVQDDAPQHNFAVQNTMLDFARAGTAFWDVDTDQLEAEMASFHKTRALREEINHLEDEVEAARQDRDFYSQPGAPVERRMEAEEAYLHATLELEAARVRLDALS